MYNKHKYLKSNDKRILHKVKKQWVTVSLALLLAIGGGAVATTIHTSANADSTNNQSTTAIKPVPVQLKLMGSSNNITAEANSLHKSLISNSESTAHNIREFGSSTPISIQTGNYQGLNYRYNPVNKSVEFTNGNLNWRSNDNNSFIGKNSVNIPKGFQTALSVKFDDAITTHGLTNLDNLFWNNSYVQSIDFGNGFDTSHVNNMWGMIASDVSLAHVKFGSKFSTQNVTNMGDLFTKDNYLHSITIKSANTKFNKSIDLPNNMYKEGSDTPNNFGQGNRGTFINKIFTTHISNPNSDIKRDIPSLSNPIWNQNFHYNNPLGQANDIEAINPHYKDGKVKYFDILHLWNPGFSGPRNEWYHIKTSDFTNFKPAYPNPLSISNVAIPDARYMADGQSRVEVSPSDTEPIPWGQVASGSEINNRKVDGSSWVTGNDQWNNPVSPDAKLAFFATYTDANSANGTYLAYSNPDGNGGFKQFRPYQANAIFDGSIANAGTEFRDPSISTYNNGNSLVAYIAGGGNKKAFVLTSNDAIHWTYRRNLDIDVSNLPVFKGISNSIETPHLEILNGQPILFFSAQTTSHSQESMDYVTGCLDNGIFQLDNNSKSGMIDYGFDDYAGDFVKVGSHLVYLGWFGNWGYYTGSHMGGFTLPYVVDWNGHSIDMTSIEPSQPVNPVSTTNLQDTYPANSKVSVNFNTPISSFDLNLARANDNNNHVEFTFNNGTLTAARRGSANTASNFTHSVNLGTNDLSNIQFYLDNTSIEAYVPEAHKIMAILDFDNTQNTPYNLTSNVPAKIDSYQFHMGQAPTLENINNINSEYSADKAELAKDWNAINGHSNASANSSKALLDQNFNDIQNELIKANTNISQANSYNGDARQHVYIALANDPINLAKTKLYQSNIQLKNLDNIATPYIDASEADTRIANYYKNSVANSVAKANQQTAKNAAYAADENIINQQKASVANSVNAANQQKANQAAQQADQRIAQQQRTSVANSVAAANRARANHAAQVADQNILNQQKQSVANSVTAANQRTATSAANSADKSIESSIANSYAKSADNSIVNSYRNSASASVSAANSSYANTAAGKAAAKSGASSADKSIESSIANSYAKSADTSIANSYKNSVDNSVRAANQSKANSAAKSSDTSIANSAAQSADQSIENSEAKNASQQISSQSQQPVTPFIPMDNVIPTPTAITSNSVMNNSNNDNVMSSNSFDLNSSVTTSSNVSKNVKRRVSKPVMKKLVNNQIPLLGLAKRTYFYQHDEAFVFTNRMKKQANVLQATVWPNHHVVYRVRIDKRTGYMYGYLKKLVKPELFTKRNMYIHVGKRMIKLPMRRFNRIMINHAVCYAGKNYVKYYVNYGRKRGVIYGKLPKITKRIRTNKGTYSKYYQVIPKRYHYVNVKKPLLIYNNKHFTKRNHRGSIRKGITIRVKRLVRDGNMTRFELMNGRYITGLKSFVKLMK